MKKRSYQDLCDQNLLILFQAGEDGAFTEIFERYGNRLYLHALKMLRDRDAAQDVVQEIFTKLWLKRDQFVLTSSLSSYLYAAIRNKILDILSHEKVVMRYQQSLQRTITQGEFITDDWIREKELAEIIEKEIGLLPPKMKEVFELSRKDHLSYNEIAVKLNISENTVRKHISKAIKKLKLKLDFALIVTLILLNV